MQKTTQNALFVGLLLVAGIVSFQGIFTALGYGASAQEVITRRIATITASNQPTDQSTTTPTYFAEHACPDKAQKGDYNCDDKVDYDDFTIFQRDFKRDETPLSPYFEWVRHFVFDVKPTTNPSASPAPSVSLSPSPSTQIQTHIQSVINKVEESSIKSNLESIVDKDTQSGSDVVQTRYSGTPGNQAEAAYIKSFFEGLGIQVEYQPFTFVSRAGENISTNNIIARIPGTDTANWYIAMAHMDSISPESTRKTTAPGADDNGSGTVAVMEMAKAIKQSGVPLNRSLEFVLYSGEEDGLNGSYYYVDHIPSGKKILAALNFDMIGNKGAQPDCVNMNFKDGSGGNLITDTIIDVNNAFSIGLNTKSQPSTETRSDHYAFWRKNKVATFGHECEFSSVYHQVTDTPDHVSYSQITKTAKAVGGALVKMSHEGQGQQLQLASSDVLAAETSNNQNQPESAKTQTAPILAYIEYQTSADLQTLHGIASNFIAYIEEEYIETPVFLGMFTATGVDAAEKAGFTVNIVDENANLNQYEYLYYPKSGQGSLLKSLGKVTEIAPRYYLVKLDAGKKFDHSGESAQFFDLPLPINENLPQFSDVRITLAPTQTPTISSSITPANSYSSVARKTTLPLLLTIGAVVATILGYILLRRKS